MTCTRETGRWRLAAAAACALASACGTSTVPNRRPTAPGSTATGARVPPAAATASSPEPPASPYKRGPFAVGERTLIFIDHSRQIHLPGQPPRPRILVTVIRYPATGAPGSSETGNAPPDSGAGPFPLVIFGHGFAVTPAPYAPLLHSWAAAGYVIAAPVFPLENANAPGGPNEADLVNQPRDMSFLISTLRAASADPRSLLASLLDSRQVAVTGQSDGGETALAVAYDRYFRDRRVRAAIILSGAKIPGVGGFDFPAPSPPLLATQGTADTVNPPSFTSDFFGIAPPPKYLLTMFGASHLGPYTGQQPQTGIVARVTIAFLDHYLKGDSPALAQMIAAGDVRGTSAVTAYR